MVQSEMWGAVRKSPEGREFIVVSEIGVLREETEREVKRNEGLITGWHKANPVQRIVRFDLTEKES